MRTYVHWLKINGTVGVRDETKQYREIQNYINRYPDSTATIYMCELSLFNYVVKLECNQDWENLDLYANSGFHTLRRLTRKPANIFNPKPFVIPERLTQNPT